MYDIMSGKRNLRNRVIDLEKLSDVLKQNTGLAKNELNNKENSNIKNPSNFDKKKTSKAHKSTFKKCLHNNTDEKENNKNICNDASIVSHIQKSKINLVRQNSSIKRKLVCPLKEKNSEDTVDCTDYIKRKIKPNLSVQKQSAKKKSVSEQRDIKLKKFKSVSNRNVSKTKIVKSKIRNKKSSNVKKINAKNEVIKTKLSTTKSAKDFPVWKKNTNVFSKRKKCHNVDVYDIHLDEDLLSTEVEVKEKSHCKKNTNGRIRKKGPLLTKSVKPQKKILSSDSKPPEKRLKLKADHILTNEKLTDTQPTKIVAAETLSFNQNGNDETCVLVSEINLQTTLSNSGIYDDFVVPLQPAGLEIQSTEKQSESRVHKNRYVSDLVDELEKSFLIPRMTSTPDAVNLKLGKHTQKGRTVKVTDISSIPPCNIHLNTTIATPSSPSNNAPKDLEEENCDITLFESPQKQEKKTKKGTGLVSPKKLIQINLFGEILRSPSSEDSLEDSVLMPQKAYTPDNFKNHLVRTKRNAQSRKEPKKSKQDLFIEEMTQHFDDIGHTELCVE